MRTTQITALPQKAGVPSSDTRLSIEGLIVLIWSRRWLFLCVSLVFAGLIVTWAYVATPVYKVAVKMMPQDGEKGGGALQSLLGQFGGLADLAGLNLGGSADTEEAIALLKSRAVFESFAARENLMPVLFPKDWNPVKKRWRSHLKHVPTMNDAWSRFDHKIRHVDQNNKTKVVTLQISWRNRYQAAAWANELVHLVNQEMRRRAIDEAQASLVSLQKQLARTEDVGLRDSIVRLMQVQINQEVLAKSRPDYAFAVLDPAVVPDANDFAWPLRGIMLFLALPFGIVMGSLAVVMLQMTGDFTRRVKRLIANYR